MSSMRSRQTGHVGSSTRECVGGGKGLRYVGFEEGVKGSCGEGEGKDVLGVWRVMLLTKRTWQVSGCCSLQSA